MLVDAARLVEREARVFRKVWHASVFSAFLLPILFLGAMGLGVGSLVETGSGDLGSLSYLEFVAPGLLVASACQVATWSSLWPVLGGIKWDGRYLAMVSTPLAPADIFLGFLGWIALRVAVASSMFLVVAAAMGALLSSTAPLTIPATVLTAVAFASLCGAFAMTQADESRFTLVFRLVFVPIFMFSGTFFPAGELSDGIAWLVWLSPLWHGIELARHTTTGDGGIARDVVHVAFLCAVVIARNAVGAPDLHPAADPMRDGRFVVERNARATRGQWLMFVTACFEALLYLLALGVGVGALVGDVAGPDGDPVSYLDFVAPAMLAAAAMTSAVYDTTYYIFMRMRYEGTYKAMLATPLRCGDIVAGEIGWVIVHGLVSAAAFLLAMLMFGVTASWSAVLVIPATGCISFGFAGLGLAATSYMRSTADFDLVDATMLPMFLLAGTFFPVASYPVVLEWVARATPLYQAAELLRDLVLGDLSWATAGHLAYLLVMGGVSSWVATNRLRRSLSA